MVTMICDLIFEITCLFGLIGLKVTDEITFYQFIVGIIIYYGLQRFLSLTHDLDISVEETNE